MWALRRRSRVEVMGNLSRAFSVNGRRVRRLVVVLACAALAVAPAAAWVMRRAAPHQAAPAALTVAPQRGALGAPREPVPTADEEGERTVPQSRSAPAGDRLRPSPRDSRQGPPAMKRAHPSVPKQTSRSQASPPAPRLTAPPADPGRQFDLVRSAAGSGRASAQTQDPAGSPAVGRVDPSTTAQGQAATGQASAPGADGQGAGSSVGAGSGGGGALGAGASPAAGGGARTGAPGPQDPSTAGPVQLLPPRVITFAGTDYPGEAFRVTVQRQDLGSNLFYQGTEGNVRVRALVRADGHLGQVEVASSSGSAILDRAATDAVRRWVFAPATRNGVPLDAYVTFTIRYIVR